MHTLIVEGMSCGHCVASVTKAVQSLDKDAKVDVNLNNRTVHAQTRAPLDDVRHAIEEAGYPVQDAR